MKKLIITADLIVPFEDVRLENFEKYTLQNHLNQLAKTHSKDRVLQIRSYVRTIFAEAVDRDYLAKDPARSLKVPANLREVDKTTLTWEQLRAALDRVLERSPRDWILMMLDMANALRPSELFCLRWRSFLEVPLLLDIQETLYKGKIRPYGKTKGEHHAGPNRGSAGPESSGMARGTQKERHGCLAGRVHIPRPFRWADGSEQLPEARSAQTG